MSSSDEISNIKPTDHNDSKWHEILTGPVKYIAEAGGKQLRSKLMWAFNPWLQIPADRIDAISQVISTLHDLSLLLDDIQDFSVLRRGLPVAHNMFGVLPVINSTWYVGSTVKYYVEDTYPDQEIAKAVNDLYYQQSIEVIRGQGKDIYWRDFGICPSEEEFKKMVIQKTGALFVLMVKNMQLFSDFKKDITKLIELLALYFQIRNDYINLTCEEYFEKKTYCEDLTEGKFGFPVVHAINNNPIHSKEILDIVKQRTTDNEVKRRCVKLLEASGSLEYTKTYLDDLQKGIQAEIDELGENKLLEEVLNELYSYKV